MYFIVFKGKGGKTVFFKFGLAPTFEVQVKVFEVHFVLHNVFYDIFLWTRKRDLRSHESERTLKYKKVIPQSDNSSCRVTFH